MANYYANWREDAFACGSCGWKGKGAQCDQGEMHRELSELCCPSCGQEVGTVMFPTIEESRKNWDVVSEADKKVIEYIEMRQKDFAISRLKSKEQLPDIEGDDLIFTWDIQNCQSGGDTLIKYGGEIIWREPAFYEGYERFAEVANILKEKYGNRLQDLIPTRKSYLYLYGDRLSAPDLITKVRKSLSNQF